MGSVGSQCPFIQSRMSCRSQDAATAIRGLRCVPHPSRGTAEKSARAEVSEINPECQNKQNVNFMDVEASHRSAPDQVRKRSSARALIVVVAGMMSIGGCMSPQFTRFPSWYTQFPAAENAAYSRQDPFPDPDIGPSTDSSPRGYERPRSTARQAAEQRLLQGLPIGPESVPPGIPQGSRNNDQAVY